MEGNFRTTSRVYNTLIHELGHASHWDTARWHYRNCDDLIKESWADCIAAAFSSNRYNGNWHPDSDAPNYNDFFLKQTDKKENMDTPDGIVEYTPVFIDMIDNFNQRDHFNDIERPIDNVSGYDITEIETALYKATTVCRFLNNITLQTTNPTEQNLEELFRFYHRLCIPQ